MKCFPFMRPVREARCFLAGGGAVALRKAETLRPFGVTFSVCARAILPELGAMAERTAEEYEEALLQDADFAVIATDDRAFNARVAADCRRAGIPVNCVDDKKNCDFYFPALIAAGDVVVGISTGGASPALAAALRKRIERALPPDLEDIARRAEQLRKTLSGAAYTAAVERLLEGEEI